MGAAPPFVSHRRRRTSSNIAATVSEVAIALVEPTAVLNGNQSSTGSHYRGLVENERYHNLPSFDTFSCRPADYAEGKQGCKPVGRLRPGLARGT